MIVSKKNKKNNANVNKKELEQTSIETKETKVEEIAENVTSKDTASEASKEITMSQRRARHGVLSTTMVILVIAAVIAVNAFLSTKEWNYDFTKEGLYTLSDSSKKLVGSLTKDQGIIIYFLDKKSNTNTVFKNVLSQYEKASKNIKVEYKDLELYPNFADDYLSDGQKAETGDTIVVSNGRSCYISSKEYVTNDYMTGETSLNVEPVITKAINNLVSDEVPIVYTLTGQGEQDLGSDMKAALEQDYYEIRPLDIVTNGGIPTDATVLMINAPSSDIPATMVTMIDEFMENGGKLFVVIDPNNTYANLNGMLAKYGVKVEDGIVLENGSGYYMGEYPTYLLPTLASHEITTPITQAGLKVLAPICKGLTTIKDVKDYTVTDLLTTSAESYAKKDTKSEDFSKKDEDTAGPLAVAQIVTNKDDEGILFVSGCSSMGVDEINQYVSSANTNLYNNAINFMTNQDNKISVKAPTVSNDRAVFTAFASKMILALAVIGIPLCLLIIGLVVMIARRRN